MFNGLMEKVIHAPESVQDNQGLFRIGALARQADVATETLRYYERLGLIQPAERSPANYRLYGTEARQRLHFIRRAQALGFTLDDIAELLDLHYHAGTRAAEVKRLTEARLREVEDKIADLERMRAGLARLSDECDGRGSAAECPILRALDGGFT